jgi:hypothetical protein
MGKKVPRDPNAPKRNKSAYLLYQNAMRDTFKQQNPGMSFGALSKYTSAMYAELSAEEKEVWKVRAEEDKARYLQELSVYIPNEGYDAKGDAIMPLQAATSRRKQRDPNAPKRCKSAYLLYQNAMRDQFREENPGMTFGQLSKYTSAMYKCLTAEEKEMWNQRAAEDKDRYEREMEEYVPPPGHDERGNLIDDFRFVPPKKTRKVKDPNAPKRARGSFVFFTADERPKLMEEMPGISFVDSGSIMGERWRSLSLEEKKKYEDLAAQDKIRFNSEMQHYNANNIIPSPLEAPGTAPHENMYMANMEHMQYDTYHQHQVYDHSAYHQYH